MQAPVLEITSGIGKGSRAVLNRSPFRVGASGRSDLRIEAPGVPEHLFVLLEEQTGWVIVPRDAPSGRVLVTRNGAPLQVQSSLGHGDVLGLPSGVLLRFVATAEQPKESRPVVRAATSAALLHVPRAAPMSRVQRSLSAVRERLPSGRRLFWALCGVVALAGVIVVAVFTMQRVRGEGSVLPFVAQEQPLSEVDAKLFDELLLEAYDHLERGASLLDAGVSEMALAEFARAVTTLESSRLRSNPWLRPRIEALQAQVADLYRSRKIAIPSSYASTRARVPLRPSGGVSPAQFEQAVSGVGQSFADTWRRPLVITGRDHAEHVSLYGASGAVDVRTRDLPAEQVRWLVDRFRGAGLRVKDFSTDSVLMDQVARAVAAGLSDRAGTGLHLHVDRFAGRKDRYTSMTP